jgi:peptidyl-prolyl cis-trans isomerase SurA
MAQPTGTGAAPPAAAAPQPARRPATTPASAQAAGQAAPSASQANIIVAVVNGDVISRADVAARARLLALNAGLQVASDQLSRLGPQVTRLLVDEKLRNQEVRRRRIPVTDDDVGDAVADIEKRNSLPAGGLVAQLRRAGIQPRALFDQLRSQIGWARLIRSTLGQAVEPSDADVEEFLRVAKGRTGEPEYLVSEIFIPVENPAQEAEVRRFVEEVSRQLRSGTPFQVAATQFSQAQTSLQGGDLGWIHKEQLDPEVAVLAERMPPGAISNPVRVAGGFQIITMRSRRETGRDLATLLNIRQVFLPFSSPLNRDLPPTDQQRAQVERATRLSDSARSCEAMDAAQRAANPERNADPGAIRLETVSPPQLRTLLAGLPLGRPSQPLLSNDGVMMFMVCSKEQRNLAETTPDQAKQQMLRDRVETQSRALQRDLRRRANIENRDPA